MIEQAHKEEEAKESQDLVHAKKPK
jgi:hypothetical protein